MNFEKIKRYFDMGFWNETMVNSAVLKGVITEEQAAAIINKL